jgi:hypothetical protein
MAHKQIKDYIGLATVARDDLVLSQTSDLTKYNAPTHAEVLALLAAADIPDLDASKITTGTLAEARLPAVSSSSSGVVPETSGASTGDVASVKSDGTIEYVPPAGGGIDSGTSFPASPSAGDIFYRTDIREIAYYDGTRWVGNEVTISFAPYNTFAFDMSLSNSIPFFTAIAEDLKITKASIGLWSGGLTWDASNYWTVLFRLRNASSVDNALDSFTVQTQPDWDVFDFDIVGTIINATDQMMYVSLIPTGSPSNISAGFYFTARKVFM